MERDKHHERRREINEHYERERRAEQVQTLKREVAERLTDGYRWSGGWFGGEGPNDGYRRAAFRYEGLRSDEHPLLKLFVTKTSRAAKGLKVGYTKSVIGGTRSKLLALDMPVITFNEVMRGVIRIDVDGTFSSTGAIYRALAEVKAPWPNLVTGHREADDSWTNPHFYYVLEHSVCFTERGDVRIMRLFNAVSRGLVHALLRLGADPGGLSNPNRGKNPLSPLWHTEIIRDEPWSLDELKDMVRLNVSTEHLVRLAAEVLEPVVELKGGARLPSNSFFTRLQERACEIVAAHYKAGDREQFDAEMQIHALELCGDFAKVRERTLRAVARRVADYVWAHYNPRVQPHKVRKGRGRCHHEVQGKTLKERQQIGARAVAADRAARSLAVLVDAYRAVAETGAKPTQQAVLATAEAAGIKGIATVKRHWNAVLAAVGSPGATREQGIRRSIDKKLIRSAVQGGAEDTPPHPPVGGASEGTAHPPRWMAAPGDRVSLSVFLVTTGRVECAPDQDGPVEMGASVVGCGQACRLARPECDIARRQGWRGTSHRKRCRSP